MMLVQQRMRPARKCTFKKVGEEKKEAIGLVCLLLALGRQTATARDQSCNDERGQLGGEGGPMNIQRAKWTPRLIENSYSSRQGSQASLRRRHVRESSRDKAARLERSAPLIAGETREERRSHLKYHQKQETTHLPCNGKVWRYVSSPRRPRHAK